MTHADLGDLCQQPTLKVSSEENAKLVYDSTTELHQPVQSILSALDRRAMGLRKSANYDAALRDANVMQQLSTFSALGYLRAAEVYAEQGKQNHVIDICNQGLDMIDTNDPHYAALRQIKTDAEQRQSNCVDFVSKLPIDLVTTMLIPLFMNMDDKPLDTLTPCPYLYVSTVWRDRIIQCFGGLSFDIGRNENDGDPKAFQLKRFAQYTKGIEVPFYSEATWLPAFVQKNDFRMLQRLTLRGFVGHDGRRLLSSLKSVSSTLTHLHIHMKSITTLDVSQIVVACPNLVSLWVHNPYQVKFKTRKKTWPKLKRLTIQDAELLIIPDTLFDIAERFPSLDQLELHPLQRINSAVFTSLCYPRMNTLTVTVDGWDTQVGYSHQGNGPDAVTDISVVEQYDGEQTCDNISPLLKDYQTTVERMTWSMEPKIGDNDLYDFQYPRLKKLSLDKSGWWIPRNAPILEELKVTSRTIRASSSPSVLDTVPPNLKKLEIDLAWRPDLEDKKPLANYLHRFAQHPHLTELAIFSYHVDEIDTVLDAITCLGGLQRLMINFPSEMDNSQIQRFFKAIANGCPRLSCLEMKCHHTQTAFVMDALHSLQHLPYLAISVQGKWGSTKVEPSFWEAIKMLSQLKSIRVKRKMVANMDDVRRLKEQRPDLDIIVDQYFPRF